MNDRELKISDSPKYADYRGEKINLLWLVPITQKDKEFIENNDVDEYLKDKDLSKIHVLGSSNCE